MCCKAVGTFADVRFSWEGRPPLCRPTNLEKSQISVCDFSTSLQIGVGSRFVEAAGAGLAPQVRHMVRIAHEGP